MEGAWHRPPALQDLSLLLNGSLLQKNRPYLRAVQEPQSTGSNLLLTVPGPRKRITEGTFNSVVSLLHKKHPDCFAQATLVQGETAIELCADESDENTAVKTDLLQQQTLQVPGGGAGAGATTVLRVSPTRGPLPANVQVLQINGVPSQYRRQGLATALLLHHGYSTADFTVLAEGVGRHGAAVQSINPDLGNGRVYLAYVRVPEGDLHLGKLPPAILVEQQTLKLKRQRGSGLTGSGPPSPAHKSPAQQPPSPQPSVASAELHSDRAASATALAQQPSSPRTPKLIRSGARSPSGGRGFPRSPEGICLPPAVLFAATNTSQTPDSVSASLQASPVKVVADVLQKHFSASADVAIPEVAELQTWQPAPSTVKKAKAAARRAAKQAESPAKPEGVSKAGLKTRGKPRTTAAAAAMSRSPYPARSNAGKGGWETKRGFGGGAGAPSTQS